MPRAVEAVAVYSGRAAVGAAQQRSGVRDEGVEVAHGHGVGRHQSGARWQGIGQQARHSSRQQRAVADGGAERSAGGGIDLAPGIEPAPRRRPSPGRTGGGNGAQGLHGGGDVAGEAEHGSLPAVLGVDEHDMAGTGALDPQANGLGGDSAARHHHHVGRHPVDQFRVCEEMVSGRHDAGTLAVCSEGPTAHVRDGLAHDGPARPRCEADRLGSPALLPRQPPTRPGAHDHCTSLELVSDTRERDERIGCRPAPVIVRCGTGFRSRHGRRARRRPGQRRRGAPEARSEAS